MTADERYFVIISDADGAYVYSMGHNELLLKLPHWEQVYGPPIFLDSWPTGGSQPTDWSSRHGKLTDKGWTPVILVVRGTVVQVHPPEGWRIE